MSLLFWSALAATVGLAVRAKGQWEGYHRGQVERTALVNGIAAAGGAGAVTLGLGVAKAVLGL